ncbi:unnamed protein product [Coffea canephora]|uniref:Uncharacterized protein n=1 Tax=Coffea canephora TaxID=49390 RepID=A0A068TMS6_COFCA|nr:unnamed protein product [Coffea canephora]
MYFVLWADYPDSKYKGNSKNKCWKSEEFDQLTGDSCFESFSCVTVVHAIPVVKIADWGNLEPGM